MNIIEELYNGNIAPQNQKFKNNSEYDRVLKEVLGKENEIEKILDEPSQEVFSQFLALTEELGRLETKERFIDGFKLGAQFIMDTFLLPRESAFEDFFQNTEKASGKEPKPPAKK